MSIPSIRMLLFPLLVLNPSIAALAQIRTSVTCGPPALSIYKRAICLDDGYVWICAVQTEHVQSVRSQQELRTSTTHGIPLIAATLRRVEFRDPCGLSRERRSILHSTTAS